MEYVKCLLQFAIQLIMQFATESLNSLIHLSPQWLISH
jgi:hypothetical protein